MRTRTPPEITKRHSQEGLGTSSSPSCPLHCRNAAAKAQRGKQTVSPTGVMKAQVGNCSIRMRAGHNSSMLTGTFCTQHTLHTAGIVASAGNAAVNTTGLLGEVEDGKGRSPGAAVTRTCIYCIFLWRTFTLFPSISYRNCFFLNFGF